MILMPFYASYLEPSDWGTLSIFLFFGPVLVGLISMGLPRASYYFYFKSDSDYKKLQSTNYFSICIIMVIGGIILNKYLEFISHYLFKNTMSGNMLLLSYVSGCFQALTLYVEDILTGQERSKAFSVIILSKFLIGASISIFLILNTSMTLMARINGILISNIICFIISIYFMREYFIFKYSIITLKKSLKFSYPEIPISIVGLIISSLDKILLTNLRGLESLGIFSFGSKFIDLARQIPNAIRKSWNPFFFNTINKNTKESRKIIYSRFEKIIFLVSLPCVSIVLFSEDIILIFGNSNYHASSYIIPIYAFTYYISTIDFLSSNQITASEKLMNQLPSALIGGLFAIILNIILIPRFGAIGAALAAAIHFIISHLINLYFGQKVLPLPINFKRLATFFFVLIIISSLSYLFIIMPLPLYVKILFKLLVILIFTIFIIRLSNIQLNSIKLLIYDFKKIFFN